MEHKRTTNYSDVETEMNTHPESEQSKTGTKKVTNALKKLAIYAVGGALPNRYQDRLAKRYEGYDKLDATATSGMGEIITAAGIVLSGASVIGANVVLTGGAALAGYLAMYLFGEGAFRMVSTAAQMNPGERERRTVEGSLFTAAPLWAYDKICDKWGKKEER